MSSSNNCTPVGGVLFSFVVSENGDRIDGLSTDPLTVLSCILRRSSKDDQQARLLKAQPSLHHAPARQAEPTNIAKSAAVQVVLVAARAAKKPSHVACHWRIDFERNVTMFLLVKTAGWDFAQKVRGAANSVDQLQKFSLSHPGGRTCTFKTAGPGSACRQEQRSGLLAVDDTAFHHEGNFL